MSTVSGRGGVDPTEALMGATLQVSRAHLLLSGTLEWAPRPVRAHTHEALDILEQALATLRELVVTLGDPGLRSAERRGDRAL
jgi:hypothetical protein